MLGVRRTTSNLGSSDRADAGSIRYYRGYVHVLNPDLLRSLLVLGRLFARRNPKPGPHIVAPARGSGARRVARCCRFVTRRT
jgi:hypothetical protein